LKLEASNLGQIIGRLMAESGAKRGPKPSRAEKRGVRQQVMELVTKMGEVGALM
jgi:hypothetical protein